MKYGNLNLGQIEAVVNKLGGIDGVNKLLRGELIVSELVRSWREENNVVYFSLTSDGTTGEQWIARLENNGFFVSKDAKIVLRSENFKPTSDVYEIAILKGEFFRDNERTTKNIRKEANNQNFLTPNAEVACLIRGKFSDKELEAMGLYWIVAMHEPIKDSDGDPRLLNAGRDGRGSWLSTDDGSPVREWGCGGGFAFVVSQVSNS